MKHNLALNSKEVAKSVPGYTSDLPRSTEGISWQHLMIDSTLRITDSATYPTASRAASHSPMDHETDPSTSDGTSQRNSKMKYMHTTNTYYHNKFTARKGGLTPKNSPLKHRARTSHNPSNETAFGPPHSDSNRREVSYVTPIDSKNFLPYRTQHILGYRTKPQAQPE